MTSRIEWNIPAWSISVEWFAYLMFPLLLPLMAGVGDRAGVLLVKVVLMLSVLAAFFWMAGARSIGATIPQLGLSRCLLEFMLGVGLCLIYGITGAPGKAKQLVLVALAAVAAIATASLHLPDFMLIPAAFALLIFSMIGEATPLYRHLSCRPFLWLGEISYSLYMAHYFVRDWVKFAAGDKANPAIFLLYMALAVAAGILLHRLVERPGRQLFRRFTLRSA